MIIQMIVSDSSLLLIFTQIISNIITVFYGIQMLIKMAFKLVKAAIKFNYRGLFVGPNSLIHVLKEEKNQKKILVAFFNIILYLAVILFGIYCSVFPQQLSFEEDGDITKFLLCVLTPQIVFLNWLGIGYITLQRTFGVGGAVTVFLSLWLSLLGLLIFCLFNQPTIGSYDSMIVPFSNCIAYICIIGMLILAFYEIPKLYKTVIKQDTCNLESWIDSLRHRLRESKPRKMILTVLFNTVFYVFVIYVFLCLSISIMEWNDPTEPLTVSYAVGIIITVFICWVTIGFPNLRSTFGTKFAVIILLCLLLNLLAMVVFLLIFNQPYLPKITP